MAQDPIFQPFGSGGLDHEDATLASLDPRLSRTHYFDGRLLQAVDLTRDQIYLDERLREVGQVLGAGVMRGLEASLAGGQRIRVEPGIAVTPSGRVLELAGRALEVNLADRALISELNDGGVRRFNRGLYAVTLRYAEVGSDSAEAFPRDLAEARGLRFNTFSEGVELTLTALRLPLPTGPALAARAALVRELLLAPGQPAEIPGDAVALALLAIDRDTPAWLDRGLLRRPLRGHDATRAVQQDLAAHYAELLAAVRTERRAASLGEDFPAAQYFRLLPPCGQLPKAAVDPAAGRQGYFPAGFRVSVAPVRRDDLPALLAECEALDPVDLEREREADIMVLAPLSDTDFAWQGRRLEHEPAGDAALDLLGHRWLPQIDPLALRLKRPAAGHEIDTDAAVWRTIWSQTDARTLWYLRRPPRVAETPVSAVVLARGFELPAAEDASLPEVQQLRDALQKAKDQIAALKKQVAELSQDTTGTETAARIKTLEEQLAEAKATSTARATQLEQIQAVNAKLRASLDPARLMELRGTTDEAARSAASRLSAKLAKDDARRTALAEAVMLVDARYEQVLWPTLEAVVKAGKLEPFAGFLREARTSDQPLGVPVAERGAEFGLTQKLRGTWKSLAA